MSQSLTNKTRPEKSLRECGRCGQRKPLGDFYRHNGCVDRRCKNCYGAWGADWAERNPEKKRQIRRDSARKRYAEDPLAFRRRALGNKCAVCKRPETAVERRGGKAKEPAVDHDHDTGAIRGLLCWRCHAVIGRMDEKSTTLKAAASYLGTSVGLVGGRLMRKQLPEGR